MKRELLCIQCPLGCRISVDMDQEGNIQSVSGYTCNNGKAYAISECTNPKRTLTTILPVEGGTIPISVRSDAPVDKDKVFDCLTFLRAVKAPHGVKLGDVIVADVLGTGVNIIATRDDWNRS